MEVGNAPFSVAVSKAHGRIFVTNRGGRRATDKDTVAPSSGTAMVTDPVTGASTTGTLSVVDAETLAVREVTVGLAPSHDGAERRREAAGGRQQPLRLRYARRHRQAQPPREIKIPTFPTAMLGSQPIALMFTPDGKTLYVACGGNNAIAAVRKNGSQVESRRRAADRLVPLRHRDRRAKAALRILNIKGIGNTANNKGGFNSRQYEGSLRAHSRADCRCSCEAGTREVKAANSPVYEPAGGVANLASLGIQHVFLIVKENRTYDQVFGDIGKGNSDPKLVHVPAATSRPTITRWPRSTSLLDNFYTGGAISFDGHQWLMQAFVSDYVERAFAASPRGYAWNMADSLVVAPTGFFWQSATKPLNVRIYGEFQLPARWDPATQSAVDMNEKDVLLVERIPEGLSRRELADDGGIAQRRAGAAAILQPALSVNNSPASPTRSAPRSSCASWPSTRSSNTAEPHHPHAEQRSHQRHASRLADAARHGGR